MWRYLVGRGGKDQLTCYSHHLVCHCLKQLCRVSDGRVTSHKVIKDAGKVVTVSANCGGRRSLGQREVRQEDGNKWGVLEVDIGEARSVVDDTAVTIHTPWNTTSEGDMTLSTLINIVDHSNTRARSSFFSTCKMLVKYWKLPVVNLASCKKMLVDFFTTNLKYVHS